MSNNKTALKHSVLAVVKLLAHLIISETGECNTTLHMYHLTQVISLK
jgi:hypothetical protein